MSYYEICNATRKKIDEFLWQEYLDADDKTLNLIEYHYNKLYKEIDDDYLKYKPSLWKKRYIHSLKDKRVIEFMHHYISEEKKFFILKIEVERFAENLKSRERSKIKLSEINSIYSDIQDKIWGFNKKDLEWSADKNIFTNEQIDIYLLICRYVLNQKLIQIYNSTIKDLLIIKEKIYFLNQFIELFEYEMYFLNKTVAINNYDIQSFEVIKLRNLELSIDSIFNKFGQQYFLNELLSIALIEKQNDIDSILMSSDMELFFSQFKDLKKKSKNRVLMNSTFEGVGGVLKINLKLIPLRTSQAILLMSLIKFITLSVIILSLILIGILYFYIYFAIYLLVAIIYLTMKAFYQFENIKEANQQIKKYGK